MKVVCLSVIMLLALLLGLPACEPQVLCGDNDSRYIAVDGLTVTAYSRYGGLLSGALAGKTDEMLLKLELKQRLYGSAPASRGGFAAMADCITIVPEYTEQVDSLVVTSRFDYDAQHPTGTPLNDIVRISSYNNQLLPLRTFLVEPQSPGTINNQMLTFSKAPASPGAQQFRLRYHQTNGNVYTAETAALGIRL